MIKLRYGSAVISIPASALSKIGEAGEAELRVLLCVASGESDPEKIAAECKTDLLNVQGALSFWRGAGVIEGDAQPGRRRITPADSTSRVYTGEEIADIRKGDLMIDSLLNKCGEILGSHVFTHAESSSVIYMRRGLGLDPEFIILLCSHYAMRDKVTIRFIEKKAISLYDEGIRSLPALEAYLDGETKKHDVESLVRSLFGLGERALVPREREYISNWVKWQIPEELIRRAYEETVANTDRPTLAYANAVIDNWHRSGVENGEQAEKQKNEFKEKKQRGRKTDRKKQAGFDLDEFFGRAIARTENGPDDKEGD